MLRKPGTATRMTAICATIVLLPVAAAAQEACTSYTVTTGDSLGSIAEAAYGTFDYQNIFNANRNVIGSNPNTLEEGTVLQLPCDDGTISGGEDFAVIIQEQEEIAAARPKTNVYAPPVKFLAGGNYAPFSDESLSGGGFLVRLAETALHRGGNDRDYSTAFVNDWGSHLDTLLPTGAFDLGLGWYMPDCSKLDLLSEAMAYRCNEFDTTVPVYEPVVGYFTAKGSEYANAASFSDFEGARICRMDGYFTHDLEEEGLSPPVIELVRPTLPSECIEALLDGTADIAGMEVQSAADAIAKLGVAQEVVENPNLAKVLAMGFITHKSNPFGRQYIALLNRGLNEMRQTGEWYAIISSTLAEHNQMMLSQ